MEQPADSILEDMLKDLKFTCPYKPFGCEEILKYASFEKHIKTYCQYRLKKKQKFNKLSIPSYRKESETIKEYVLYKIQCRVDKSTYEVERRFSEFYDLYVYFTQQQQFLGFNIPVVPPKFMNPFMSEEQIATRQLELEVFLTLLVDNPQLENDEVLLRFLTEQESKVPV